MFKLHFFLVVALAFALPQDLPGQGVNCMPGTASASLEECRSHFEYACCAGRICYQSSPGVYEVCVNRGEFGLDSLMRRPGICVLE